jgi:hypothetical protein
LGKPTNNGNKFNGGAKVHIYGDFKTYIGTDVISIDSFVVHQDAYLQNSNFSPSNKLKVLGTTSYAQVSNPAPDTLRLPAAAWSSAQAVNSNFSAANLESWWTTKKNNGTLFNGWLVLNVTGSVNIDTTGGPFKRKVMILDSSASNNIGLQQDSWYNCADTSNTLIYVKSTSWATLLFKLAANKKFRGYIYVNTTGTNTQFQFGTGSVFNGAMCFRKGGFDINSPGAFTLDYSDGSIGQAAVQELIDMSVLFPAN